MLYVKTRQGHECSRTADGCVSRINGHDWHCSGRHQHKLRTSTAALPAKEEDEAETQVARHGRKKPERKPLDLALAREVVCYELPESKRVCPHDGSVLVEIGVEVSEQLDITPTGVGDLPTLHGILFLHFQRVRKMKCNFVFMTPRR
ncbi:hypothetical protein G3O00_42295 [Burkholderia sp. Ac-20384]|nr:hypothetical protein [Burkholderia sp. Ac-20384]